MIRRIQLLYMIIKELLFPVEQFLVIQNHIHRVAIMIMDRIEMKIIIMILRLYQPILIYNVWLILIKLIHKGKYFIK
jgi:hypothetical protein